MAHRERLCTFTSRRWMAEADCRAASVQASHWTGCVAKLCKRVQTGLLVPKLRPSPMYHHPQFIVHKQGGCVSSQKPRGRYASVPHKQLHYGSLVLRCDLAQFPHEHAALRAYLLAASCARQQRLMQVTDVPHGYRQGCSQLLTGLGLICTPVLSHYHQS